MSTKVINQRQLNDHFKEHVRLRIEQKLQQISEDKRQPDFDAVVDSYSILLCVMVLAEENNIARATDRIYNLMLANPATALSWHDTRALLVERLQEFSTEVFILQELYEMQAEDAAGTEIAASMELRLPEIKPSHVGKPTASDAGQ